MARPRGAAGIDIFPEADELDVEPVERIENIEEVLDRPGDPVGSPYQDDIEPAAACIRHHLAKSGPLGLRPGDSVGVFLHDLTAALGSHWRRSCICISGC